jgi:pyruvate kinase
MRRPIAVLQDLAGLKIRIGELASGTVTLEAGAAFTLTLREVLGSRQEVSVPYSHLTEDLRPGDIVLLGDGDLELRVIDITVWPRGMKKEVLDADAWTKDVRSRFRAASPLQRNPSLPSDQRAASGT